MLGRTTPAPYRSPYFSVLPRGHDALATTTTAEVKDKTNITSPVTFQSIPTNSNNGPHHYTENDEPSYGHISSTVHGDLNPPRTASANNGLDHPSTAGNAVGSGVDAPVPGSKAPSSARTDLDALSGGSQPGVLTPVEADQQSHVTEPRDGSADLHGSKTVLERTRTEEDSLLTSTAPVHRMPSSGSPGRNLDTGFPNVVARELSHPVSSSTSAIPLADRHPNAQSPKSGLVNGVDEAFDILEHHTKPSLLPSVEAGITHHTSAAVASPWLHADPARTSVLSSDMSTRRVSVSADESDDDIIYETISDPQGSPTEVHIADESSSDDVESGSDDEQERVTTDSRQLYRAPGGGPDHYDEDQAEEDDASSDSSSEESSIADEPSVALPSASIQQQEAYPAAILTMASPDRPYNIFKGTQLRSDDSTGSLTIALAVLTSQAEATGTLIKAGPAFFPDGYEKSTEIKGFPWICSIRSCRMAFTSTFGLGAHFRVSPLLTISALYSD